MTRPVVLESRLRILSMGWGVQSWTLAAMSVLGHIEPFDAIVNADTAYESSTTYQFIHEWTPWLTAQGANVVSLNRRPADVWTASDIAKIPAFVTSQSASGKRRGMKQRSCTRDWKVRPQNVWTREEMRKRGIPLIKNAVVKCLGISLDEFERAKHSELAYITHSYPLLDMRMTRADCVAWLKAQGLPTPPKSACVFCPYTNARKKYDTVNRPRVDIEMAIRADELIRNAVPGMSLYVSDLAIPLEVAIRQVGQLGYEQIDFIEQCDSGHCFL